SAGALPKYENLKTHEMHVRPPRCLTSSRAQGRLDIRTLRPDFVRRSAASELVAADRGGRVWSCAPGGRSRPHDTNPTLPTLSVPTGRSPAIPQLAESRVEIVVGERRKTVDADSVLLAAV